MAVARELPRLRDHRALVTALTWLATRVAFAGIVWGVLGHVSADTSRFFVPQARAVLAGGIPYRDFSTAYGPLFAPLLAPAVAAFGAVGPGLVFLAADLGAWRALAAREGEGSDAAWAWVAMPVVWLSTVRYAQDEALAACSVALAWWSLGRGRHGAAGTALGFGLLGTKPLFALPALAFLLALFDARAARRLATAAAIPVVLVYGALLLLGAPVLQPFQSQADHFGMGPTLWRVPAVLAGFDPGPVGWLPFILLATAGIILLVRRRAGAESHGAWQFAACAALFPKFLPMYALIWIPLLGVWSTGHVDRQRWLVLEGTFLPLAWICESGPLQGAFGPFWQWTSGIVVLGTGALALWPIAEMLAPDAAPSTSDHTR